MRKIESYFLVPTPKNLRKMKLNHRLIWLKVLQYCLKEILISAFAMYYKTVTEYDFLIMNFLI
jgi:hypothetical protein